MSGRPAAAGLEPVASLPSYGLPLPGPEAEAVRVDGKTYRLPGIRRRPAAWRRWLAVLGPGLIAASAGNDAGGIATYSSVGARFGYDLLWVLVLLTVALGLIQEMCARLGAATGRGLLDLVRERFGPGWALLAIGMVVVANFGLTLSEFAGIGAAADLLGFPKAVAVPLAALGLWGLILFGSYARAEKLFVAMTVVFFAYPVAAVLAHPDWGAVVHGAFVPTLRSDPDYLYLLVGLLGTTITPFMQVFHQSSTVENGAARQSYGAERWDAYAGAIFSNLMSMAMIVATAAALFARHGPRELETAADAARALEPVAGQAAQVIFAVGLLGATLLAAAIVPLATAYAVAETFGLPKGVDLDWRRAPMFFGLFTGMLALGAGLALVPGMPVMKLLLGTQVFNALLLPPLLLFILLLANDKQLMGRLRNGRFTNLLGGATWLGVTGSVGAMLYTQLFM